MPDHSILLATLLPLALTPDPPLGVLASDLAVGFHHSNDRQDAYHLMHLSPNHSTHEHDEMELSTRMVALSDNCVCTLLLGLEFAAQSHQ